MFGWIARLIDRLDAAADREVAQAMATLEPAPVTFAIPGAPPVGSKVLARNGKIYRRRDFTPDESDRYVYHVQIWGIWEPVGCRHIHPGDCTNINEPGAERWFFWYALLAEHGPVTLLPAEPDPDTDRLYGPPGQRWGDPDTPCPWKFLNAKHAAEFGLPDGVKLGDACALGIGHIGPHMDSGGHALASPALDRWHAPETTTASVTQEDLGTPCTCGHPERHRSGCPRFDRMSGDGSD